MALGIKTSVANALSVQNIDMAANAVESSIIASLKTGTLTVYPPDINAWSVGETAVVLASALVTDRYIVGIDRTISATPQYAVPIYGYCGTAGYLTIGFANIAGSAGSAESCICNYIRINTVA